MSSSTETEQCPALGTSAAAWKRWRAAAGGCAPRQASKREAGMLAQAFTEAADRVQRGDRSGRWKPSGRRNKRLGRVLTN